MSKRNVQRTPVSLIITVFLLICMMVGCVDSSSGDKSDKSSKKNTEVSISTEEDSTNSSEVAGSEETKEAETTTVPETTTIIQQASSQSETSVNPGSIPAYSNAAYVAVNNNSPYFSDSDKVRTDAFENYSSLDSLGRCGVAYANICKELMPTEERGKIGSVKPSGWQSVRYDNVDGNYLYNRCHLIGYQLAGENANEKNLITGTRYLNIEGMLPFENMVADYVNETGHHVLYRVTPVFEGNNLLASGVLMEAYSVEDAGAGIEFCVYCYNVQPGINIDYSNGNSSQGETTVQTTAPQTTAPQTQATTAVQTQPQTQAATEANTDNLIYTYIINKNTKVFHNPNCSSVGQMKESNKIEYNGSRDDLINQGYSPCKRCNP